MFSKVHRPKKNEAGLIVGGSAYIAQSSYDKEIESGHSRQTIIERLGRVVEMSSDRKSGLFLSPSRGPVVYNVTENSFSSVAQDDPRLARITGIPENREHVTFGDVYLLISCSNVLE